MKGIFNDVYKGQPQSSTFRNIFREVFGDEYPEEADPCGLSTMTDLRNIVKYIGVGKGQSFVDLGCGRGGAGLWVARETGAHLTGVDISNVAIEEAKQRISDFGLDGQAEFRVGDFARTGLKEAGFDGAMSVDALYLVPDKTGSVYETVRILRPGARFVCTTWDVDLPSMIRDHRPLLQQAGFEVERYDVTPDWERRQRAVHESILAHKQELIQEMGEDSAKFWIVGAQTELPRLSHMKRILIVARKR
jgi:ubiquinone/menaquinone biosynthesis C-methylase UbiE